MREQLRRTGGVVSAHLRRHVIAYVALLIALTGTTYAAGGKGGGGKIGADDFKRITSRDGNAVVVPPGADGESTVRCRNGERALVWLPVALGGTSGLFTTTAAAFGGSKNGLPKGYRLRVRNETAQPHEFVASALCLKR